MGKKKNRGQAPIFEAVENRTLLSVVFTPTSITVVGSPAGGNDIIIADDGTSFTVTGGGTARGTAPLLANANKVTINVKTGNGDGNTVTYDAATTADAPLKQLTMIGGKQGDTLVIENGFIKNANLNAGNGINLVEISTATITGKLAIVGGSGPDDVVIGETASPELDGNVSIQMGNGANECDINSGDYGTPAGVIGTRKIPGSTFTITGGKDVDVIDIDTGALPGPVTFEGTFSVKTFAGADVVNINATDEGMGELGAVLFMDAATFDLGIGNNVMSISTFVDDDPAPVTFADFANILLGAGNDTLNMASGADGNNVSFEGNSTINLGSADTFTGDLLNVDTDGVAASVLFGSDVGAPRDNDIILGGGLKDATEIAPAGAIQLLSGCDFDMVAVRSTAVTTDLRTSFTGMMIDPGIQSILMQFTFQSEL